MGLAATPDRLSPAADGAESGADVDAHCALVISEHAQHILVTNGQTISCTGLTATLYNTPRTARWA